MTPSSEGEGEGMVASLTVDKFYQINSWRMPEIILQIDGSSFVSFFPI